MARKKIEKIEDQSGNDAINSKPALMARIKGSINVESGAVMDFFSCHAHFVKEEWIEVPAGFEDEAKAHPFLETKEA
jgi:hypothetical protein